MKLEGTIAVVTTISSTYVPPYSCSVCLTHSFEEAHNYLKQIYEEDLAWHKESDGDRFVMSYHTDDWNYAWIEVPVKSFKRTYYLSHEVHDPR